MPKYNCNNWNYGQISRKKISRSSIRLSIQLKVKFAIKFIIRHKNMFDFKFKYIQWIQSIHTMNSKYTFRISILKI